MFGLDKISWAQFTLFLLYGSGAWYSGLFALALIKGRGRNKMPLFEYDDGDGIQKEVLLPVKVSANDFPREMVLFARQEDEDLITNLYEENDIDDGYPLEQFSDNGLSVTEEMLKNFQVL